MSQTYFAILTAIGEAKLANAVALGTQLQVSRMAVGDGNGNLPIPNRSQTALVNEQYRADLNTLSVDPVNDSQIIAELVIPETTGGFWLREMGLYDAAGDLIAVSNCPPSYKPELAEGSGRTQVLRMILIVSSTAAVQLKIDPSVVLATRAYADSLITAHQVAADPHKQYKLRGTFTSLSANALLTAAHEGFIVLDATAGDRALTLPLNDATFGVRDLLIRRLDNTGNRAKVQTSGTDKIKFHTHLNPAGYAFLYLMGAGDWWHLRSDGAGNWWPIARRDDAPLGRLSFETSTAIQPGGYGLPHGVLLVRADWPWIWDHAQASGMLVDDAGRAGFEGCWTRGDGATTVRSPDIRAEFLRALDEGRGVDINRIAGSAKLDQIQEHLHGLRQVTGSLAAGSNPYIISGARLSGANTDALASGRSGSETFPRHIASPARIKLI
ncbi:phage tail protein [Pseudomonas marincola]|uniref:phage tail protein n=1 Tax=Pseudomonas marincola TaxID=437900 RepID=UPI0008E98270|nr:phage tail protein [Pseudomonas marincola]SFT49108.1 Phage tail-collar fibre protein [Pseudomonas marincola]